MAHTVQLTAQGILLDGEPQALLCSSLFYFRIPRESWEARMDALLLCGYNSIDVYFPWNYHEQSPGQWEFTGQRDVEAFLQLAAQKGLYVVARPGPYICSEWDGGALPSWLAQARIRTTDPGYLRQLDFWLTQILPRIARHTLPNGGTVLLVQLENELDFFDCPDPKRYLEHLAATARRHGINVPFIACAGQWDVAGACGWAEDVAPAFNVYSDDLDPWVEEKCLRASSAMRIRGLPLLITETNRTHAYLKRELCCGARLLSPYNQTAGTNMDLYHGVNNWGPAETPFSFAATDYDFQSMITAEGRLRGEALHGRLLGALLRSFPSLGGGHPCPADAPAVEADFPLPRCVLHNGRTAPHTPLYAFADGALLSLCNLGGADGTAALDVGKDRLSVPVPAGQTVLLPINLSLRRFGIPAEVVWSEAQVAWAAQTERGCELLLYCEGPARTRIRVDGGMQSGYVLHGRADEELAVGGKTLCVMLCSAEDAARMASPWFAALKPDPEPAVVELELLGTQRLELPEPDRQITPSALERNGVYRGAGIYSLRLEREETLLLEGVADILRVVREREPVLARHCNGGTVELRSSGSLRLLAESWGHSNFSDVRVPSLRMGSGKGIGSIARVLSAEDISALWSVAADSYPFSGRYEPPAADAFAPLAGVNDYEKPGAPLCLAYSRVIFTPEGCDRLWLHLQGNRAHTVVCVDGIPVSSVNPADPYVNLTGAVKAGCSHTLTLRTLKANCKEPVGQVLLLGGEAVKQCGFAPMELDWYIRAAGAEITPDRPAVAEITAPALFRFTLPGAPRDARLRFEGRDAELFCVLRGHMAGRILLPAEGFPPCRGGDGLSFAIPAAWTGREPLSVLIFPSGTRPLLTRVIMEY